VPLLEANRRPWLAAQLATADRARIGARQDLEIIRKLLQPTRAAEQLLRTFFGARGKFGAAKIADHQRVAAQDEPGLFAAGVIGHGNAAARACGRVCAEPWP